MKKFFLIIFSIYCSSTLGQETKLVLNKIEENNFNMDGMISDEEIQGAKVLEILYEETPSFNTVPSKKTVGYLTYSNKFLYVGIKAYRDNVVAPVTTRDNSAIWTGDLAGFAIDTYEDARNHLIIISDMLHNSSDYSHYQSSPDVNSFKNSNFRKKITYV